jgi:hypothetical protein
MSIILLPFVETERRESMGGGDGSERHYIGSWGEENNIFGLEGSQAMPASPSGRGKAYDQN